MRKIILLATISAAAPLAARAAGPAISLQGRGVQIYACRPAPGGFAWHFVAPEADLFDAEGHKAGHHFAGPSWQANDGSLVTGELMASGAATKPGAVPWLLLRAKTHGGSGVFASAGYIMRVDTQGGAAPATGCDGAHAGAEQRVSYTATYILLPD